MTFPTLSPQSIATLVHEFYDDVRADQALAPIFNRAIGAHWQAHLERMIDFWSTVMLGTRSFQGHVFAQHMQLSGIQPHHFERWFALFNATARRLFSPAVAEEFMVVAQRIGASLQYGFFGDIRAQSPSERAA